MTYDQEYYQNNKDKFLEWQRQYREKNRDAILEKRRIYDKKNREHQLQLKYQWRKDNLSKFKKQKKEENKKYYAKKKNDEEFIIKKRKRDNEYYARLKREKPEELRAKWRKWHKNNPRSSPRYSLEVQDAMNNARRRDKNTCQWQGCGLTYRQVPIHVHHIFPRSEYPELELVERYMISYCPNHHALFHRYRGDPYAEMINPRYQEGSSVLFRGMEIET